MTRDSAIPRSPASSRSPPARTPGSPARATRTASPRSSASLRVRPACGLRPACGASLRTAACGVRAASAQFAGGAERKRAVRLPADRRCRPRPGADADDHLRAWQPHQPARRSRRRWPRPISSRRGGRRGRPWLRRAVRLCSLPRPRASAGGRLPGARRLSRTTRLTRRSRRRRPPALTTDLARFPSPAFPRRAAQPTPRGTAPAARLPPRPATRRPATRRPATARPGTAARTPTAERRRWRARMPGRPGDSPAAQATGRRRAASSPARRAASSPAPGTASSSPASRRVSSSPASRPCRPAMAVTTARNRARRRYGWHAAGGFPSPGAATPGR